MMNRMRLLCRFRWRLLLGMGTAVLAGLLWPIRPVVAGTCHGVLGIPDMGACIDAQVYAFWKGMAMGAWNNDRQLLMATYQLDRFRWWLVESVFLSIYTQVTTWTGTLVAPIATVALTIAVLAIILLPVFGFTVFGNIRQILVLLVVAPILLTSSGPLLIEVEQLRSDTASAIFADVGDVPTDIFGVGDSGTTMLPVRALYPASCPSGGLDRGHGNSVKLDDRAAAVLGATALDIFCPHATAYPELPAAWYAPAPAGFQFAYHGDLGDVDDGTVRSDFKDRINRGYWHALYATIPCLLALCDSFIQLIFSLCMVMLWIGFPLALLFAFFQQTYAGLFQLVAGAGQILRVSWSISFMIAIVDVSLGAAARLQNASGYVSFAGVSVLLLLYCGWVALLTLKESFGILGQTVAAPAGMTAPVPVAQARDVALSGVALGGAALSGGATMALTGLMAAHQGASGGYALGMALSTQRPLAQLGALASAMGTLNPELEQGLFTGQVLGRGEGLANLRAVRGMRSDLARAAGTGSALPDSAQLHPEDERERHIQAQVHRGAAEDKRRWEAAKQVLAASKQRLSEATAYRDGLEEPQLAAARADEAAAKQRWEQGQQADDRGIYLAAKARLARLEKLGDRDARQAEQAARLVYEAAQRIEVERRQTYERRVMDLAGTAGDIRAVVAEIASEVGPHSGTVESPTTLSHPRQGTTVDGAVVEPAVLRGSAPALPPAATAAAAPTATRPAQQEED